MAALLLASLIHIAPCVAQTTDSNPAIKQQLPNPDPDQPEPPTPIPVLIDPAPTSLGHRLEQNRMRAAQLVTDAGAERAFDVIYNEDRTAVVVVHEASGLRCGAENLVEVIVISAESVGCSEDAPQVIRSTVLASRSAQPESLDIRLTELVRSVAARHRAMRRLDIAESDSVLRPGAFPRRRMARFTTSDNQFVVLVCVADVGDWQLATVSFAPIQDGRWQLALGIAEFQLLTTLVSINGASAEVPMSDRP